MISRRNVKMLSTRAAKRYVLCKSNLEGRTIWKQSTSQTYIYYLYVYCIYFRNINVLLGLKFNIFLFVSTFNLI